MIRAALPGLRFTVEALVYQGDVVVEQITVHATHQGEMMDMPASGRRVRFTEVDIARVEGGKIVERRSEWDQLGLLRQIGAIPASTGARSSLPSQQRRRLSPAEAVHHRSHRSGSAAAEVGFRSPW